MKYLLYLVAATFLFGSSFVATKILLANNPPVLLAAFRFVVGGLFTLIFLAATRNSLILTRGATVKTLLVGTFQTATCMGLLFLCIERTNAPLAAVLLFTNPLWVTIWGVVFLKERLRPVQIIGLLSGFVGVVLTVGITSGSKFDALGIAFGLASAICWSLATMVSRISKDATNPILINGWQMFIGSMMLFAWSYVAETKGFSLPTNYDVFWFAWLAIMASAFAFGFWFSALRIGGAIKSSSYLFLTPMFTMLLSIPILGNVPTMWQIIGFLFVGSGLYLINRQP